MKKVLRTISIFLMVALLCSLVFVGCGNNNGETAEGPKSDDATESKDSQVEPVKISYAAAAGATDQKAYTYYLEGLEEVYPEITVEPHYYPTQEEFWKMIPAAVASGTAPDFIHVSDDSIYEYIVKEIVTPLDDLMVEAKFDRSRFISSLFKGWSNEGKTYGVPNYAWTSMLAVNLELFKKAGITKMPETFEEVLDAAIKCNNPDEGIYGIVANMHEFHITQYVHAFGGGWDYGKTINTPENVKGIQFFVDLFTKHNVAVAPNQLGLGWDGEVFSKGKAAMSTGGPWYLAYLNENNPDLKWAAVPIPTGTVQAPFAYSGGYSILEASEHKLEAMKVITHMTRDEAFEYTVNVEKKVPAVEKYMPTYIEQNPMLEDVLNTMDKGLPFRYPVDTNRFKEELLKGVEELCFKPGDKTVQQFLDEMQQKFVE